MSSDVVIEARGLSKCYRLWRSPAARLKSPLLAAAAEGMQHRGPLAKALWRKAHTYFSDFYALREISLSIRRGGIVGDRQEARERVGQQARRVIGHHADSDRRMIRLCSLIERHVGALVSAQQTRRAQGPARGTQRPSPPEHRRGEISAHQREVVALKKVVGTQRTGAGLIVEFGDHLGCVLPPELRVASATHVQRPIGEDGIA
jgi:hypothetical protein